MKKLKLYLETTVFNRYFEPDSKHHEETLLLFEEIAAGKFEVYTSVYVIEELSKTADEAKRDAMLELLNRSCASVFDRSEETEALAWQYALHNIISENHSYDRWHIACAAVNRLDAIVSYNFTHINRLSTKEKTRLVNQLNGYPVVSIIQPLEVIGNDI